jgi:hypothetical protein
MLTGSRLRKLSTPQTGVEFQEHIHDLHAHRRRQLAHQHMSTTSSTQQQPIVYEIGQPTLANIFLQAATIVEHETAADTHDGKKGAKKKKKLDNKRLAEKYDIKYLTACVLKRFI